LPTTTEPVKQADIHIAVGMALHDLGDLEEGLKHAQLGAQLAEAANGLECACAGYFGAGRVQLNRRHLDEAHDDFIKSMKYANLTGFESFLNVVRGGVAMTDFERGRSRDLEGLRIAVNNASAINDGYAAATMSENLASALLKLGRRDEAETALKGSLDYYRGAGMRPFLAKALRLSSDLHEARGDMVAAARDREEANAITADLAARNHSPSAGMQA
jgi:tetratricopeptide (TPR) repeat protein